MVTEVFFFAQVFIPELPRSTLQSVHPHQHVALFGPLRGNLMEAILISLPNIPQSIKRNFAANVVVELEVVEVN